MEIILTFDTEIWFDSWSNIDEKFEETFDTYIYGTTTDGKFGLPFTLKVLKECNLPATFFVEPLFALRFGKDPLKIIVEMILAHGQDVQLHLHPEWLDEATTTILKGIYNKRRYLKQFSQDEQKIIIEKGMQYLKEVGCTNIKAFRAGGFGANRDTLIALKDNGILIDCSYNRCLFDEIDFYPEQVLTQPILLEGVYEYPMTVFKDGIARIKHLQIGACSFGEMRDFLWRSSDAGWSHVNFLSHNFELINRIKKRKDKIVIKRFLDLCNFLHKNNKIFKCTTFRDIQPVSTENQFELISVNPIYTYQRLLQNLIGRFKRI